MGEFVSSVRTAHYLLIAVTAAIVAFSLSPRDADEYLSAHLEAVFVSKFHSYALIPRGLKHGRPSDSDTREVKDQFVEQGLAVAETFTYKGPVLAIKLEAPVRFSDVATISNDFSGAKVVVPTNEQVKRTVQNISGSSAQCVRGGATAPCPAYSNDWTLQNVAVAEKRADGYDSPSFIYPIELENSDSRLLLKFVKGNESRTYVVAETPTFWTVIPGITRSAHHLFRMNVESNPLIWQARGYTQMFGRVLRPLREKWCDWQLTRRNKSIRETKERLRDEYQRSGNILEFVLNEQALMRQLVNDYAPTCYPGQHIRGLPHLDAVWYDIKDKSPDEAAALLQRKIGETRSYVNIAGLQVEERSARAVLPATCFAISLFLLSNLTILHQRVKEGRRAPSDDDLIDHPWMGLYDDRLSKALTWLTIFGFPVFIPPFMLIPGAESLDLVTITAIFLSLCTGVIAFRSMKIVRYLRAARIPRLRPPDDRSPA